MKERDGLSEAKSTAWSNSCSRRGFLKNMGVATLGAGATALLPGMAKGAQLESGGNMAELQTSAAGELYWGMVRARFPLLRRITYLNTGTEGSMSKYVLWRIRRDFDDFAEFPHDAILNDKRCSMALPDVRKKAGEFLGGVGADELVMTTNTTEGLGYVVNGLDFEEGDEILTHLHFLPYNACAYVRQDRHKIKLVEVELPTPAKTVDEIVALFEQAVTSRTKLMMFCHINYSTGLRMPVKELCALAGSKGIPTLIDGAHAIGMIDVNVEDIGCDFYSGACHKWLCAPPGTGVLYLRREMQERVWPVVTEAYTSPGALITTTMFQERGQQCTPAIAGVIDAIDLQSAIGRDKIQNRVLELHTYAKKKLTDLYGEDKVLSPQADELSTGLVSFNPFDTPYEKAGGNISKLYNALYDENIVTRSVNFYDKKADSNQIRALRLSTHLYNNYLDIDKAIDAIEGIVKDIKAGTL